MVMGNLWLTSSYGFIALRLVGNLDPIVSGFGKLPENNPLQLNETFLRHNRQIVKQRVQLSLGMRHILLIWF